MLRKMLPPPALALVLLWGFLVSCPAFAAPASPAPAAAPSPTATPADADHNLDHDEDGVLEVNPYGPTVTNPATLTNVGLPEYEFFYYVSNNAPGNYIRSTQPQLLVKYTFAKHWMINVSSSTFVNQLTTTGTSSAFADPVWSIKYLYKDPEPKKSSQSLQFSYKYPFGTSTSGINTGFADYTLYWLYSRDIGDVHLDANVWVSNLGAPDFTRRITLNESAAISIPIGKGLNYQAEVYHLGGNGPLSSVVSTLHAVGWSIAPNVSVAAGVDIGLNQPAPRINYMLGTIFFIGGGGHKKTAGVEALPSALRPYGR